MPIIAIMEASVKAGCAFVSLISDFVVTIDPQNRRLAAVYINELVDFDRLTVAIMKVVTISVEPIDPRIFWISASKVSNPRIFLISASRVSHSVAKNSPTMDCEATNEFKIAI